MVKRQTQFFLLMILMAALPATSQAQDINSVIHNVIKAMGSENLKTIRFSASGSSYISGKDRSYVKSYTRDIDLNTPATRIQMVSEKGTPPTEQKENQNIATDAPWSNQYELWTYPWEFVKAAVANNATVSTQTVSAAKFTVVTFTVQNKYKVSGFINDKNLIEKIQTWIDPNNTLVETIYRDYMDFHGFQFPTTIIEKQSGELAKILMVSDVKPNAVLN
jgi:hypothetical protein